MTKQSAKLELAEKVQFVYPASPFDFAGDMVVPLGGKYGRFRDYWVKPQTDVLRAANDSFVSVANGDIPPTTRFWIEMTKGYGKDLIATLLVDWLLLFSTHPVTVEIGAFTQKQASEPLVINKQLFSVDEPLNRLIASRLEQTKEKITAKPVTSTRRGLSEAIILTNESAGTHGSRPSLIICNELSHVREEAFMATMFDNASKVPHCIGWVCTNAGDTSSWQYRWRESVLQSPEWFKLIANRPAPWITPQALADSERRNAPTRHKKYFYGVWSSDAGDALPLDQINACCTLPGPPRRKPGLLYIGGLDLGIKLDHSAYTVVAADVENQCIELVDFQRWKPQDFADGKVSLNVVQDAILESRLRFNTVCCCYDPFQAALMAENLQRQGMATLEVPFTSQTKARLAKVATEMFSNGLVRLWNSPEFIDDLLRLRIKEGAFGDLTLTAIRDSSGMGHADLATSFLIAADAALEIARVGIDVTVRNGSDYAEVLVPC